MDEGDADAGGGEVEEGVEAEDEAAEPCQTMYLHSAPSLDQKHLLHLVIIVEHSIVMGS